MVRHPAVAGQFYPSQPDRLLSDVRAMLGPLPQTRMKAVGVVSPHAGYVYSGGIAGRLLASVEIPRTVLLLGPNHHGIGSPAALYPAGEWETPLGCVPVSARLTGLLKEYVAGCTEDAVAHQYEHSLEVQIPFLQVLRPDVDIAAVCLGFGDYAAARRVGEGVAAAVEAFGEDVLIIASSDMSHYESDDTARELDDLAVRKVLDLDPQGLHHVCRERRITMCGVVPATAMLVAAGNLGATRAELVGYATSGDVNGDKRRVVGYAGIAVC